MKKFVLVFAALLVASSMPLGAEVLNPGEGLAAPMSRGGCAIGWLAQVMRLNGIQESQLKKLPAGMSIMLPENCAQQRAPRQVRRETADIIAAAKKLDETGQFDGRLAEAETTITQLRTQAAVDKKADQELIQTLNARLLAAEHDVDSGSGKKLANQPPSPKTAMMLGNATGLAAGILLCGLCFWQWQKRTTIFPRAVKVFFEGRLWTFIWSMAHMGYRCPVPGCHEKKLGKKNLKGHLKNAHEELRLEVVNESAVPVSGLVLTN